MKYYILELETGSNMQFKMFSLVPDNNNFNNYYYRLSS